MLEMEAVEKMMKGSKQSKSLPALNSSANVLHPVSVVFSVAFLAG
jgi:hypothetical protein